MFGFKFKIRLIDLYFENIGNKCKLVYRGNENIKYLEIS